MSERKKKWRKLCSCICVAAVAAGMCSEPVLAGKLEGVQVSETSETDLTIPLPDENGVTVTEWEEFMQALQEKKSPITVAGPISIGDQTEADGQMKPVMIPENTVILGTEEGGIVCRSPIQLEGDGICFRDIELKFDSGDGMSSQPHREIFLAGYSLVLDNVRTYVKGGGSALGPIGGTEEELLPTVYAGGYQGTQIGSNASLTVQNSNAETMFAGIYMGHEAENDNKMPYDGNAVLKMDAKAVVREGVHTDKNSLAQIQITGNGEAKAKRFYGNENTTLTIRQSSMTNSEAEAVLIEGVKHIVLDEGASLSPQSSVFCDVTLKNNACLDLNGMKSAQIRGNFNGGGEESERGVLVLNSEGTLTIDGTVTGTTQFQTHYRNFPGTLISGRKYITAKRNSESDFVLPDKKIKEEYTLDYSEGGWTAHYHGEIYEEPQIGSIEILSFPETVDINKITEEANQESSAACRVIWKDLQGIPFDAETVEEQNFYGFDYVIGIKTEYWNGEAPEILAKTDWSNTVYLTAAEEADTYYLQGAEGVRTGDYTFLLCSEYLSEDLNTVADVKALKDTVKAAMRIRLYDGEMEKPTVPEKPGETVKPVVPEKPQHVHHYTSKITRESTCTRKGEKTFQCSGCKSSYKKELPLKTHTYKTVLTRAVPGRDGSSVKRCGVCRKVAGKSVIYYPKTVKLTVSDYVYNGGRRKPGVSVKDRKGRVVSSSQYTVSCQNNKNVGQAVLTVKFKDRYGGTMKKTFRILPKASGISKLTAKSRSMVVKWKKQSTQTDGYEIQYSTSKKFSKKTTKTETIKNRKTTSKTIRKLKAGKKYYVRVRTYKMVKVNGKSTKFCSAWSKAKTVKVKK